MPNIIPVFSSPSMECWRRAKTMATLVRIRSEAQGLSANLAYPVLVFALVSLVEPRVQPGRTMYRVHFLLLRCSGY